MANITLKVDDEILEKARRIAFERSTSVNAVVIQELTEFVTAHQRKEVVLEGLASFCSRCQARVGRRNWRREDLHER
jgi:hypothetical protein